MLKFKKDKYCCDGFAMNHLERNTTNCIRVIKVNYSQLGLLEIRYTTKDSVKRRVIEDSDIPFRFFYMQPYLKFDLLMPGALMISFCPYCGVNLFTFYGRDRDINEYVNEIEGETFT